jgi:hypothetical protein
MFWVVFLLQLSFIPFMLDFGNRGLLLMDLANDCLQIEKIIKNQPLYDNIQIKRRLGPKIYNRAFELETKDFKIMRVLQIIDSLEAGGAERMAVNYANALANEIDFRHSW